MLLLLPQGHHGMLVVMWFINDTFEHDYWLPPSFGSSWHLLTKHVRIRKKDTTCFTSLCVCVCLSICRSVTKLEMSREEEDFRKVGNKEGNGKYAIGGQKQGLAGKRVEVGELGIQGGENK